MVWLDLLVIGLATHQLVNIWRFSSLLAGWREWIETERHRDDFGRIWLVGPRLCRWLTSLHGCPWCLSVNVAAVLYTAYYSGLLGGIDVPIVQILAVSQMANLLHHLTGHRGPKLN